MNQLETLLKRCQKSPMFFIENFCQVKHPTAGIIPFKLFKYQKTSIMCYLRYRHNIYKKTRQCGISTLTGAFALWYSMFFAQKKVLIVSKRDLDAKEFLKKNIRFVYDHLPEFFYDIYGKDPPINNEHSIGFSNGSVIRSLTSHPNTMRSESASLNIIDEAAFMLHMEQMWSGAAPCAAYNTIVSTSKGLKRLDHILHEAGNKTAKSFSDHNISMVTDDGLKHSDRIWNNGYHRTIKIKTNLGYTFEATPWHKIRIFDKEGQYVWKELGSIKKGDLACLMINTCEGEPSEDLAFDLNFSEIPMSVLSSGPDVLMDYMRRLFDGSKSFIASSESFADQIRTSLLSLGILTKTSEDGKTINLINKEQLIFKHSKVSEFCFKAGVPQIDEISYKYALELLNNTEDTVFGSLLRRGIIFDEIMGIEASSAMTADLCVPSNNTYIANGFVSHNTLQHGGCVDRHTLILSKDGLREIGSYHTDDSLAWENVGGEVLNTNGRDQITHSYYNGIKETKQITTEDGYFVEATLEHKFKILDYDGEIRWKEVSELKEGDELILSCKVEKYGNETELDINKMDINQRIPDKIFLSSFEQRFAYILRLFGLNRIVLSTDIVFLRQIQTLLLSMGIRSKIIEDNRFSWLELKIDNEAKLNVKDNLSRQYAKELTNPELIHASIGYLANNDLFVDKIKKLEKSESSTYDLTIKDSHTYIANGFISHNSSIVISTTFGYGNWYHTTWDDALNKRNDFNPIIIDWWDMDWTIQYQDPISGQKKSISPTKDMRECKTKEEKEKWGKYYSPWLEEQYRILQQKGEAHLFRQEVLAEFIGVGNTVLSREQLLHIETTKSDKYGTVGPVRYFHPVTEQEIVLDFEHELRIWKKPVKPEPDIIENGRIIKPGDSGHTYSIGVDISSGEADDFSAIVVIDCNTLEQVADLNIKVQPAVLLLMIDYLGRWYNGAYVVPERTGMGIPVCQSLYHDIAYTNVYRMKTPAGKIGKKIGYPTSPVHKPQLNKCLLDNTGPDGVAIYSDRLLEQLKIYVHLGSEKTGHVSGPGNHSDLAIALALALLGVTEAVQSDQSSLLPSKGTSNEIGPDQIKARDASNKITEMLFSGGTNALMPYMIMNNPRELLTPEEELIMFTQQLGGIPIGSKNANPMVNKPKYKIK